MWRLGDRAAYDLCGRIRMSVWVVRARASGLSRVVWVKPKTVQARGSEYRGLGGVLPFAALQCCFLGTRADLLHWPYVM